ncbi:MAG: cytochrome c oxidase subunit I [Calditrichaeota bacterium]|nr:cytochrome c oxidase subunit I [Calditrichota bacterium]
MASHAITEVQHVEENYLEVKSRWRGIFAWIFSTDHKRIGILYLVSSLTFFVVAATIGIFMRLEQLTMGETLMSPDVYNRLFTLHGVIMIFLLIIPGIPATFGNFFLPIQIGAKDVAFPRLNLLSWWLYIIGAILAITTLFLPGSLPDTGWTFYVPYAVRTGSNVALAVFAAFILGFSSILTGLNFLTTIHRLRAPGMTWHRLPLFVWALYATAWIQILATPMVGITLLLIIFERVLNIGIFDPTQGGDPILFQHLFWIYSHPAVYIMVLPGFGVVSEIIPTFSRRTIFGYKLIAYSSLSIALFGSLVWGHHMFVSGESDTANIIFSFLTFFIAVPTAIKVFNWTATLYKGSIALEPPMLYVLSSIFLFAIGGFTGLMQATLPIDVHVHDTYFVVGHFHYTMFGGTIWVMLAGLLYWFPKMTGRMYNKKVAYLAWPFMFIGFNVLYGTMMYMGWKGMPRRYYDHLPEFHTDHVIATVGSWLLYIGILILLGNLVYALYRGAKAPDNPWGGATLEWKTTSPPPLENFTQEPVIKHEPYYFREEDNG